MNGTRDTLFAQIMHQLNLTVQGGDSKRLRMALNGNNRYNTYFNWTDAERERYRAQWQQLTNTSQLRKVRRDIARVRTVLATKA